MMRRWLPGAFSVLLFTGCVQPNAPQVCPAPSEYDAAALGLRELHEFGKNYEVFQVVVKVDGCVLFQTEDTSVLGRPQVELAPKPVAPGSHAIEIFTKFRSGPSADMHDYEWFETQSLRVELPASSTHTLVVRRSEVLNRDPRKRMQTDTSLE